MSPKNKLPVRKVETQARKTEAHLPALEESLSPEESRLMLHELRVQQIELEMQNDEFRRVQVELNAAKALYFELYDLAPVGYCSLNEKGVILQANLTAATVLGLPRPALVKQLFTRFILKADQDGFYLFRKHLLETGEPQACELSMVQDDGTPFRAHLAGTVGKDASNVPVHRIVMMRCDRGV